MKTKSDAITTAGKMRVVNGTNIEGRNEVIKKKLMIFLLFPI
jgi:hypothetical protein